MRGKQLIKISSPTGNVEAPERRSDLTIPPSLEELDSNDYEDIAYWSHDDWKDFKKQAPRLSSSLTLSAMKAANLLTMPGLER